ncbi:hypothetical protein DDZ18_10435 [Marinicauda salina]|uniref:DUF2846 domain-containing protein n=1 Tax=Marinicauda salina TaxID=2135793 RepID=A0A2U2BSX8_9PROT|nr:hypothetical protein [Marinicauda salina]PWE17107.1 hypothetical protein DDZ18_10435 [Marinicauda salina]
MKPAATLAAILLLTGCAQIPGAAPNVAPAEPAAGAETRLEQLPPQQLAEGECGLFVWTRAQPHRFILFENESRGMARILHDARILNIATHGGPAAFSTGTPVERTYRDAENGLIFTLEGEAGEPTAAGVRLQRGLLRTRLADGAEIVAPVLGVRSCRTDAPSPPGSTRRDR